MKKCCGWRHMQMAKGSCRAAEVNRSERERERNVETSRERVKLCVCVDVADLVELDALERDKHHTANGLRLTVLFDKLCMFI